MGSKGGKLVLKFVSKFELVYRLYFDHCMQGENNFTSLIRHVFGEPRLLGGALNLGVPQV
jgi:hypothetical protein